MKCPLCGNEFEIGESACPGCPMAANCNLMRCPNCKYEFPPDSKVLGFFRNLKMRLVETRLIASLQKIFKGEK